jgi:ABC-2 type transport system permease protein
MAQLVSSPSSTPRWTAAQTRAQFLAIAWLRWRMLINGFRRKGGTGELVGRILLYPILAGMAFGPSVLVAIGGYYFAQNQELIKVAFLLWGTFAYCQLLNIQLGQPGSTFDPTELIRFPLTSRDYVFIRLCFGLLTPGNVIGALMSISIAIGIIVAQPGMWFYALLATSVFALTNVLFSRMVFSWIDRWLATRRAREVFTALIFTFSLGIQWANFTFNPAYNHHKTTSLSPVHMQLALNIYHQIQPLIQWLPPQLIASSLIAGDRSAVALYVEYVFACALYAAVFFAVFAMRMHAEFRGENLSDAANGVAATKPKLTTPDIGTAAPIHALAPANENDAKPGNSFGLPPVTLAMVGKELLYVRRHTGLLYGLVMPIFLVLIVATKFASRGNAAWVFPAAVAYTLFAISTFSYNSLGFEGAGAQFYFLAPVRIRDVFLAKNLINFTMAFVEIVATFAIISYVAGVPSFQVAIAAVLWAAATMLVTTAFGNRRSITAPKKINPQRMANKQVSQLSALIGMGILLGSAAIAAVPAGLAIYYHVLWPLVPVFALFAAAGLFFYERSLRSLDAFALVHREELFAELTKAS